MIDFTSPSNRELLTLYTELMTELMTELRSRGIVRTSNGPGADVAEGLVQQALSLTLNVASTAGYDGIDPDGRKIEVKCRRLTRHNNSRQLSAIRNLESAHFDFLAGVLFYEDFSVMRAALIPFHVVKDHSVFVKHTNAWKFVLRSNCGTWRFDRFLQRFAVDVLARRHARERHDRYPAKDLRSAP